MADTLLTIDFSGLQDLEKLVGRVDKGVDTRAILDEGAAIVFNHIVNRYLAAVDPEGRPWIESQAARDRAERGIDGLTGFATGRLYHSLQLYRDSEDSRSIGTDVEYAPFFQNSPPGVSQKRIFLGFGPEDLSTMESLVTLRVQEMLNG